MRTYFLLTLGCPKNQVDSWTLEQRLRSAGYRAVPQPEQAALLIVNTCGFITEAKEESIAAILELAALKHSSPHKRLLVSGCFSQRNAPELARELPEVDAFFGVDCSDELLRHLNDQGLFVYTHDSRPLPADTHGSAPGPGPGSWYLKIGEGCDNRCAYCAIPLIRGPYRPRPARAILAEARRLVSQQGALEINLISQDSARYRAPDREDYTLCRLLDDLEAISGVAWIRVLYLHPAHVDDVLLRRMLQGGKVLPYFDLPVQHLADPLLQSMGRHHTYDDYRRLVDLIRSHNRESSLRSTLIIGFPGETDAHFRLLRERVEQIGFDKLGCFRYSEEDGTDAARRSHKVPAGLAEQRWQEIMELQRSVSARRLARFVGQELPVLIEEQVSDEEGLALGRSPHDAPDVDGAVVVQSEEVRMLQPGRIVRIMIRKTMEYDLYGEPV